MGCRHRKERKRENPCSNGITRSVHVSQVVDRCPNGSGVQRGVEVLVWPVPMYMLYDQNSGNGYVLGSSSQGSSPAELGPTAVKNGY